MSVTCIPTYVCGTLKISPMPYAYSTSMQLDIKFTLLIKTVPTKAFVFPSHKS